MATPNQGHFTWHELVTTDPKAALAFYQHVIGWTAAPVDGPGGPGSYQVLSAGGRGMGGMFEMTPDMRAMKMKPFWVGYVHSADVDASIARAQKLGGKLHDQVSDIPNVGRMARVSDPQGAGFIIFKPQPPPGPVPEPASGVGAVGWNELVTSDWQGAFAFYSELLGWKKDMAVDMGPMGTYQTFTTGQGGGGMMNNPDKSAAPFWKYYFNVDAMDAAIARVKEKGGKIDNGPHQVPGGDWTASGTDPQGAVFALTSKKK